MLGDLEEVLDVTFREDLDIRRVNIESRPEENKFRKDGYTLHVNLAHLDQAERDGLLELTATQFEREGRVLREDEEVETSTMMSGYTDEYDEILSYFDGVLSDRYCDIIERSLHLRTLIENKDLSKSEIQEKKGQIARRHGSEAIYLSSLVSAGYFDPDGGLHDMYVDMELNPDYSRYDFQDTLTEYMDKKLLAVFVENDDNIDDIFHEVRGRLSRYQEEDPIQEWFDIRGIGEGCEEIISSVMEKLEEEYLGIDYDEWRDGEHLWIRIYPRSLPPISP